MSHGQQRRVEFLGVKSEEFSSANRLDGRTDDGRILFRLL